MGYIIGPDGKIVDDGAGLDFSNQGLPPPPSMEEIAAMMSSGAAGGAPTPLLQDPYAAPPVMDPYGSMVPPEGAILPDPYGKVGKGSGSGSKSESKGTKTKVYGPNGVVPGNSDPYNVPKGKSQTIINKGLTEISGAAKDTNDALTQKELAAEEIAAIDRRMFDEQGADAQRRQDAEVGKANALSERTSARENIALKAKDDAVRRVKEWESEAEAAANTEVDPSRYWNNSSNFSKMLFGLGMLAGGLAENAGTGKNHMKEMLSENINRDIMAQEGQIARKMDFLKDKRGNIDLLNNLDRISIDDMDHNTLAYMTEFDIRLNAMDKDIEKTIAKYGAEKVNPLLLQTQAEFKAGRAAIREKLGSVFYEEGVRKNTQEETAKENAKNRAHQSAIQRKGWEHEEKMAQAKALAELDLDSTKGLFNTSKHGGFVETVGADGKAVRNGVVKVKPEAWVEFGKNINGISSQYIALRNLQDILEDTTRTDLVAKNKELHAAIEEVVIRSAPGSGLTPMSDSDLERLRAVQTGASGSLGDFLRGSDSGGIKEIVARNVGLNIQEGTKLMTISTEPVDGNTAVYDPAGTYLGKPGADTESDSEDAKAEYAGENGVKSTARANKANIDPSDRKKTDNVRRNVDIAFKNGSVEDLEDWVAMLKEKNDTSPTLKPGHIVETKGGILGHAEAKLRELKTVKAMEAAQAKRQEEDKEDYRKHGKLVRNKAKGK